MRHGRALNLRACAIFRFPRFPPSLRLERRLPLTGRRCSVIALTITVRSSFLTQGKGCVQLDDLLGLLLAVVMPATFNHLAGQRAGFIKRAAHSHLSSLTSSGTFLSWRLLHASQQGIGRRWSFGTNGAYGAFPPRPESGFVTPDSSEYQTGRRRRNRFAVIDKQRFLCALFPFPQ